ncbi:interleukin enhancer-binding factor 3 homolog isoform X1, putative [Babesia ovis]|uniref:Interleukin enhancer-binding factor 3 homolog isoform X1, putative n=1 Tax=Babesia ovis TaxID=5869 RepID=A0A9W5T9J3_BABOV|nr:interleukin enhancer-binding factor 3 homolog isoform X1, putative [Babesia ovis]
MEKEGTEIAAKRRVDAAKLRNNLERSIEAHKRRLERARLSKVDKSGRLCECKKCDVTSMKPSMRCTKNGAKNLGGDSLKPIASKSVRTQPMSPRTNVKPVARECNLTGRVNNGVRGAKTNVDRINGMKSQSGTPKTGRTCEGGNAVDGDLIESDSECVTTRNVEKQDQMVQTETLSSGRLSGRSQPEDASPSTNSIPDIDVSRVARRLESIRIVDSMGEEHRIDTASLETRILTVVDKIVRDKLETERNIEEAEKVALESKEEVLSPPIMGDAEKVECSTATCRKDEDVVKVRDVDEQKGVFGALFNYITCVPSKTPEYNADMKEQISSVKNVPAVGESTTTPQSVVALSQIKIEDGAQETNRFFLCGDGRKAGECWNASKTDAGSVVSDGPIDAPISHGNQTVLIDNAVLHNNMVHLPPMGMGAVPMKHVHRFVNMAETDSRMVHVNQPMPRVNGGCHHLPFATVPHVYNPNSNFYFGNGIQEPVNVGGLSGCRTRQSTSVPRKQPFSRRNNTSATTKPPVITPRIGYNPKINAALQYLPSSMLPQGQNASHVTGIGPVCMTNPPFRLLPRQPTGIFYSRNTGRAYGKQVQAAML